MEWQATSAVIQHTFGTEIACTSGSMFEEVKIDSPMKGSEAYVVSLTLLQHRTFDPMSI